MSEINKINLKISDGSDQQDKNSYFQKSITAQDVIKWIKKQEYDLNTENGLIKLLKKYPTNSYQFFINNIKKYVNQVRKKIDNE